MANIITICQGKNKQFFCTFPKGIAEAMEIKKGNKIQFLFDRGNVIIRKVER